jgi:fatty acid desaturase
VSTAGTFDIDAYLARTSALDLTNVDWAAVPCHPLPAEAIRTLKYMQDIESHTIVYLRSLLATRAIDDPDVARFLACWVYEESFHGLALERFLAAAGHPVGPRPKPHGHEGPVQWAEARATAVLSRVWPDFCAVHMTWGAINELTTLVGYRRLAARARHPVLSELLGRIALDESRHFFFYYRQAELRLRRPAVARIARLLVDRFWAPVGSGVQPASELRFMASYLFDGTRGRAAARRADETIRKLPGFATVRLLESWLDR